MGGKKLSARCDILKMGLPLGTFCDPLIYCTRMLPPPWLKSAPASVNYLYRNSYIDGLNSVVVEAVDHANDINFACFNF